ncbi:ABC-type thiamine transport system permease [Actinobacillus equuli]|nr:ABC-type thiamine transport system permease [Actinobacillus equuli]
MVFTFSVFWLLPFFKLSNEAQAKLELALVSFILLFAFISATIYQVSMGYSVMVLIASLTALATFAFAKLKMMQGDKFIIAALLSIILLISSLSFIRLLQFLFRCFMTAKRSHRNKSSEF